MNYTITIPAGASRLQTLKALWAFIKNLPEDKAYDCNFTLHNPNRTPKQNSAMHQYFRLLAKAFNDAGYTVQKVLTKPLEISWTENLVKDLLWRQIQDSMFDKDSTTKLDTAEVSKVYEELNNYTAGKLGVHVPFPSKDDKP